ncbi:hypothetical protein Hdeb2414_s0008g00271721 [Helianthus debilis subsp. tardiflorus]
MLSPTFACFSSKLQQISRYKPLLRRRFPTLAASSSVQSSLPVTSLPVSIRNACISITVFQGYTKAPAILWDFLAIGSVASAKQLTPIFKG